MSLSCSAPDGAPEQFPITALREIKILKLMDHENVVKLEEIVHAARKLPRGRGRACGCVLAVPHTVPRQPTTTTDSRAASTLCLSTWITIWAGC